MARDAEAAGALNIDVKPCTGDDAIAATEQREFPCVIITTYLGPSHNSLPWSQLSPQFSLRFLRKKFFGIGEDQN